MTRMVMMTVKMMNQVGEIVFYSEFVHFQGKQLCYYHHISLFSGCRGVSAQLVKRWPTDLVDRGRSSLEVKSSQP